MAPLPRAYTCLPGMHPSTDDRSTVLDSGGSTSVQDSILTISRRVLSRLLTTTPTRAQTWPVRSNVAHRDPRIGPERRPLNGGRRHDRGGTQRGQLQVDV